MLRRLALAAQRLDLRVPAAVRRRVRARLDRDLAAGPPPGLEDWQAPLVRRPGAPGGAGEVPGEVRVQVPVAGGDPGAGVRLRCLLVTADLDVGGMDEVVVFLARRLPGHGVATTVLHAPHGTVTDGPAQGRLGRLLRAEGVDTRQLGPAAGERWLEELAPDVVSVHGAPGWVLDACARLGIPVVETLHGAHDLLGRDPAELEARSKTLAAVVAVSELVREQFLDVNPRATERTVVIPNAVDDDRRVRVDRDAARARWGLADEFVFLSLARHCLQKNTYALVEAFADVAARHPNAHLLVAGRADDPLYFVRVERLRRGLSCADRIHLRDHYPRPAELLALADAFVMDSFFEGWSLASMEALCAGLPVVLSDVGGAREQVGDAGRRGHLVPNPLGDPLAGSWDRIRAARYVRQVNRAELVTAMCRLVDERGTWAGSREALAAESAGRFAADGCVARHARLLRDIRAGATPDSSRVP